MANVFDTTNASERKAIQKNIFDHLDADLKAVKTEKDGFERLQLLQMLQRYLILLEELHHGRLDEETVNLYLS